MSTNVDVRHLRAFVAVAEELHFTKAARRLYVAQQTLSGQIQQLEDELGTSLLRRTTRRIELTAAGQVLLSHARSVLASVDTMFEETRRAGAGEAGLLRIAYTPTVGFESLPLLTDAMHLRFPAIRLQTCEMWQAEQVEAVQAGRFDVGLARCPVLLDGLESMSIRYEPLGVVLAAGHPLTAGPEVRVRDLTPLTLEIWPRDLSPGYYDLVVNALRAFGFAGALREFENLSREVFMNDPGARAEMGAGGAFSVAFETQPVPPGFVWVRLEPAPLVPLTMFWRAPLGPAPRTLSVVAEEVAQAEHWIAAA